MENGALVMRIHRIRTEVVVAACDAELIGRDLPVGEGGRTVRVTEQFYGDRRVGKEELLLALRRATTANLLGERVLRIAHEAGLIDPGSTGTLGGVPHAEIFSMFS
ncbi:MAG: DUF424 domain-containing protein [Thermoplasmata archaeon]